MAPPIINDSDTLLEIAIITLEQPHLKFTSVYRKAIQIAPPRRHSDDSCRRRLQRKFTARREYWLERGQSERKARHAESIRRAHENMARFVEQMQPDLAFATRFAHEIAPSLKAAAQFAEQMKPYAELAGRISRQMAPLSELAQQLLPSPEVREQFAALQRAAEHMRGLKLYRD